MSGAPPGFSTAIVAAVAHELNTISSRKSISSRRRSDLGSSSYEQALLHDDDGGQKLHTTAAAENGNDASDDDTMLPDLENLNWGSLKVSEDNSVKINI